MTLHALPDPEETPDLIFGIIQNLTGVFADSFGDMTIGELIEAVSALPVRDVLKEMFK
jgi:hypothetical protein